MCRQDAKNYEPDISTDLIAHKVIGAAIEVHRVLGPGYQESICEEALCRELQERGLRFERRWQFEVTYKGRPVGEGRVDLLVEGRLIVELKSVDVLAGIHKAQTISYLKATGCQVALLINFNLPVLKDGIKRIVLTQ